jgi:cytoskeletal protein CcmA (bactofilin family)
MHAPPVSLFPPAIRLVGDLTVLGNARIECEVRGRVYVREHLHLEPNAVVHGEIHSGSLRIVPGAEVKADVAVGSAVKVKPVPSLLKFFSFGKR